MNGHSPNQTGIHKVPFPSYVPLLAQHNAQAVGGGGDVGVGRNENTILCKPESVHKNDRATASNENLDPTVNTVQGEYVSV